MSNKEYLYKKHCPLCDIRLDKLKKSDIRVVSSVKLLEKLNIAKNERLQSKNKEINDVVIKEGDLVCKSCIAFADRFRPQKSKPGKRTRSLSVNPLLREATTHESLDSQSNSTELNIEEITKIKVDIPRTKSSHSSCVICNSKKNLTTVPNEAYMDAFIDKNILIPKGN